LPQAGYSAPKQLPTRQRLEPHHILAPRRHPIAVRVIAREHQPSQASHPRPQHTAKAREREWPPCKILSKRLMCPPCGNTRIGSKIWRTFSCQRDSARPTPLHRSDRLGRHVRVPNRPGAGQTQLRVRVTRTRWLPSWRIQTRCSSSMHTHPNMLRINSLTRLT
jgi:hypothetical protein